MPIILKSSFWLLIGTRRSLFVGSLFACIGSLARPAVCCRLLVRGLQLFSVFRQGLLRYSLKVFVVVFREKGYVSHLKGSRLLICVQSSAFITLDVSVRHGIIRSIRRKCLPTSWAKWCTTGFVAKNILIRLLLHRVGKISQLRGNLYLLSISDCIKCLNSATQISRIL